MERKVILATYADLRTAQSVVRKLLQKGFQQRDVKLAVEKTNRVQQKALVSVTTFSGLVDRAMEVIKRQRPLAFEKRDENWRSREIAPATWLLNPDLFKPVELPEHETRQSHFRAS